MIRLAAPMWLALGGAGVLAAVLWLLRRRWQRYPFPIEGRVEARRGLRFTWTAAAGVLAALAFAPLAVPRRCCRDTSNTPRVSTW
jgi:hypothetical protein